MHLTSMHGKIVDSLRRNKIIKHLAKYSTFAEVPHQLLKK